MSRKVTFGSAKRGTGDVAGLLASLGRVVAVSATELAYSPSGPTTTTGIGAVVYHSTKASQLSLSTVSALIAWFERDRLKPGAYDFLQVALADMALSESTEVFRSHTKAMVSRVLDHLRQIAARRAELKAKDRAKEGKPPSAVKKPRMPDGYVRLPELLAGFDVEDCVYLESYEHTVAREKRLGAKSGRPMYWSGVAREVEVVIRSKSDPQTVNATFFADAVHPLAGQTAMMSAGVLLFNGDNDWSDVASWLSIVEEVSLVVDGIPYESTHVTVYTPDSAGHVLVGLWRTRDMESIDRFFTKLYVSNDQSTAWRELAAVGVPGAMQLMMLLRHVVSQLAEETEQEIEEHGRSGTLYMTSSGYHMRPAHVPVFGPSMRHAQTNFLRYAAWSDSTVKRYHKLFVVLSAFYDRMLNQYLPKTLRGFADANVPQTEIDEFDRQYEEVILNGGGAQVSALLPFIERAADVLDTSLLAKTINKV